jgi:hypothetical protein
MRYRLCCIGFILDPFFSFFSLLKKIEEEEEEGYTLTEWVCKRSSMIWVLVVDDPELNRPDPCITTREARPSFI